MLGVPCFAEDHEMVVRALRSFCQPNVDVVAIDNGGSLDVKVALTEMISSVSVIKNEHNVYVNPAWNQLAELFLASGAEILVLANADLEVAPGWAESILMRRRAHDREFWFGHFNDVHSPAPSDEEADSNALCSGGSFFALTRAAVKIAFPIPVELRIWYGDNWIVITLDKAGYRGVILRNVVCWPPTASVSQRRLPELNTILAQDQEAWKRIAP
jgi:hypothetical protein